MIELTVRGVLVDVEGTTSSIRFVYDEMFPFVRRELAAFLDESWDELAVARAREQLADDAHQLAPDAAPTPDDRAWVIAEVARLMDADAKTTGLKELQGLIWQQGFESGELRAHVYADVPPALARWRESGLDLRIYSSGSIAAQKLFFGHTIAGNLLPLFSGNYDTTTGPKRDASSYTAIAADWGLAAKSILFASDVAAELDAARMAGMQTALVRRPGNADVPADCDHAMVESFGELTLQHGPVQRKTPGKAEG